MGAKSSPTAGAEGELGTQEKVPSEHRHGCDQASPIYPGNLCGTGR